MYTRARTSSGDMCKNTNTSNDATRHTTHDTMRSIYYIHTHCTQSVSIQSADWSLFCSSIISMRALSLHTCVCVGVFISNRKHCRIALPCFCLSACFIAFYFTSFHFFGFSFFLVHLLGLLPLYLSFSHTPCSIVNVLGEFMTLLILYGFTTPTNRYILSVSVHYAVFVRAFK